MQSITFSVERIMRCSVPLSSTVTAVNQMVMEEVRMEPMMAVQKCTIIVFGRLNFFSSQL